MKPGIDARYGTDLEADRRAGLDEDRFAIPQQPREARLDAPGCVGDVLHVDRPAKRVMEATAAADALEPARRVVTILRSGDRAKELRVELIALEGRAIHRHELPGAAGGVNRSRSDLAPGSLLASNQDSHPHCGRARDEGHDLAHDGRVAVQIVAAGVGRTPGLTRPVAGLAFDGIGDAAAAKRTSEHVGHADEDRFGRQFRTAGVDDGEHRRPGAMCAKLTRHLKSGSTLRQIDEHGHLAAPQFAERGRRAVCPDDREVGGRQDFLGFGSIGGGAAEIEDGFQNNLCRSMVCRTKSKVLRHELFGF